MPPSEGPFAIDRRALLRSAILLVGGTTLPSAAFAASTTPFFADGERATLDLLCETMIPRTDTPGATDAGVSSFIDGLMTNWASSAHQEQMRRTIGSLGRAAQADTGKPLSALSPAEREAWLTRQDAELIAAGDADYSQFKRLVMTGYYYSEPGATQELRYELVPGVWEPSVPITAETRTWAA